MTSSRTARRRRVLVGAGVLALVGILVPVLLLHSSAPPSEGCSVGSAPTDYGLTPDQTQNAAIIAAVAAGRGLADHAVTVALAAALQETQLQNLDHGDRDSLGLFQQRPSEGWGTPAQILDPVYAATAFYDHLVLIPGWETLAVTDAAQQVQHSATPTAYAAWEGEARALAEALTGETPAGLSCRLPTFDGSSPAAGALAGAASREFGRNLLGATVETKLGWAVAAWAVGHAWRYHLATVSFDGRTWSASSGGWAGDSSAGPVVTTTSA